MVEEVLDQHGESRGNLSVWPVIADAIAETIGAGNPELMRIATVIALPISGVFNHHSIENGANF